MSKWKFNLFPYQQVSHLALVFCYIIVYYDYYGEGDTMQKFIKKLLAICFILILVTGCTKAEEKPIVFESPITSTKAHYSGRKFNKNFQL